MGMGLMKICTVGNGLIMATLAGSHLYGTNTPESDIDIRGVCLQTRESLLGFQGFEQFQPKGENAIRFANENFGYLSDDVCIYGVTKFLKLAMDCNPNIVELLFAPAFYENEIWHEIVKNSHNILSTKVKHSFSGYAFAQLKRIKRHKEWLDSAPEKPNPEEYDAVFVDGGWKWPDVNKNEILKLVAVTAHFNLDKKLGALFNRWSRKKEYQRAMDDYKSYQTWVKNRNPKRFVLEKKYGFDTKHAAHLVRLFAEASRLLTTGELVFPLPRAERELYLDVLHGAVDYDTIVKSAETYDVTLAQLAENSVLPKKPNRVAVEEMLMKINRGSL